MGIFKSIASFFKGKKDKKEALKEKDEKPIAKDDLDIISKPKPKKVIKKPKKMYKNIFFIK